MDYTHLDLTFRPLLHISVILVIFALCALFPTERVGHTSLPQYQQGLDTARVKLLWTIGKVEVLFCVIHVMILFSLIYVMDHSLLLFIQLRMTYLFKQRVGLFSKLNRDYDLLEFY